MTKEELHAKVLEWLKMRKPHAVSIRDVGSSGDNGGQPWGSELPTFWVTVDYWDEDGNTCTYEAEGTEMAFLWRWVTEGE